MFNRDTPVGDYPDDVELRNQCCGLKQPLTRAA